MKRTMIVLVALTLAAVAVAGQNPDVRLYIDFDPPNYVHELRAPAVGDTIRLCVVADSLGSDPGDGLWGAAFRVTRDFGGTYLGAVNLLDPATAPIGDPESVDGIALASGGNCIEGSVVPIAELTYLYDGTPGTISLLPHSSDGAVTEGGADASSATQAPIRKIMRQLAMNFEYFEGIYCQLTF